MGFLEIEFLCNVKPGKGVNKRINVKGRKGEKKPSHKHDFSQPNFPMFFE